MIIIKANMTKVLMTGEKSLAHLRSQQHFELQLMAFHMIVSTQVGKIHLAHTQY
jgi:hypothetical protein